MKFTLQAKYTLTILTLVTTLVLALAGLLYIEFQASNQRLSQSGSRLMQQTLTEQLHDQAATMASTLANNLREPLYAFDLDTLYDLIRGLAQAPNVTAVYVYDREGRVVHDGQQLIPHFRQPIQELVPNTQPLNHEQQAWINQQQLHLATPIKTGDTLQGGVLLIFSLSTAGNAAQQLSWDLTEQLETSFQRNLSYLLLLLVLFCLLALLLSWWLARNLTAPIHRLIRYARAIGDGELNQTIDIKNHDELGELAETFNDMGLRLQRSIAHIEHLAYRDELTGLYNRTCFQQAVNDAINRAPGQLFALLYLDLDNFKVLNDTQGHDQGDQLLQQIALDLQQVLAEHDVTTDANSSLAARFGGDEFVLALFGLTHNEQAENLANRILSSLRNSQSASLRRIHAVRASIGIALYPQDGRSLSILLKNADIALSEAKREGKDCCKRITPQLQRRLTRAYLIEQALPGALDEQAFHMHYQLQIDLLSGRLCGCEALIRWRHPELGVISPGEFLEIAEATPLIAPLGSWVIDQVCRDTRRFQAYAPDGFRVSLNLSGAQFALQDTYQEISAALQRHQLPPQSIAVELTETALLRNPAQVRQQLQQLQERGIAIWLDDFGTGYSSLNYLHNLPIQGIKIDKSFIRRLSEDDKGNQEDTQLNWAIVTLADALELDVTAEGVETPFQHQLLRDLGVHKGQGFLYGRPIPAVDFLQLLQHSHAVFIPQADTALIDSGD